MCGKYSPAISLLIVAPPPLDTFQERDKLISYEALDRHRSAASLPQASVKLGGGGGENGGLIGIIDGARKTLAHLGGLW
jgi:hypothetical protein